MILVTYKGSFCRAVQTEATSPSCNFDQPTSQPTPVHTLLQMATFLGLIQHNAGYHQDQQEQLPG
jgi:hypothetical protein